jgi:hypothetical protein
MLERGINAAAEYIRDNRVAPHMAIRTRADLLLMRPLSAASMNTASRRFIIPSHQGHGWVGSIPPRPWKMKKPWMPDQFWMGPWGMIETMCHFHSRWNKFLTRNGDNIENMLHTFAQDNEIGYEQFAMQIKIEKTVNNK